MATTAVENLAAKAEALVLEKGTAIGKVAKKNVSCENGTKVAEEQTANAELTANGELAKEKVNIKNGTKVAEAEEQRDERVQEEKEKAGNEVPKEEAEKEDLAVEVEPKTGVSRFTPVWASR